MVENISEVPESIKAGILPQKYPNLHHSSEVIWAIDNAKKAGKELPRQKDKEGKVSIYLESLLNRHGLLGGGGERQRRQIAKHVIKPDEIPEAYFDLQRRIAREQGHGDITITPEMKQQFSESVASDQTKSLENWVEYLHHPDANYPAWFRYYTIRSVLTLGSYDKENQRFNKRSAGTTAPFADLNREALAAIYDRVNKELAGESIEVLGDETLRTLLKAKNFSKLYAHAIAELTPANPEQKKEIEGEWKKYEQGSDSERAIRLAKSLQGHGTGWCTAGESTAQMQLEEGDFYVYYSKDADGHVNIPRIAIRMEDNKVSEVRGINADQNLEGVMIDTAAEKLKELPGGSEYQQKAADMKRLTDIEKKNANGEQLQVEELRFLYEIERPIMGFGYDDDPRIQEILKSRDQHQDGAVIFDCKPEQIALNVNELTSESYVLFGNFYNYNFDKLPESLRFIKGYAEFIDSSLTSLGNLESIGGEVDFRDSQITDLGELRAIGGNAYFGRSDVINLGELRAIGGNADFTHSSLADLGKLESIGGNADFRSTILSLSVPGWQGSIGGDKITSF